MNEGGDREGEVDDNYKEGGNKADREIECTEYSWSNRHRNTWQVDVLIQCNLPCQPTLMPE
jgi:hypothetical protein